MSFARESLKRMLWSVHSEQDPSECMLHLFLLKNTGWAKHKPFSYQWEAWGLRYAKSYLAFSIGYVSLLDFNDNYLSILQLFYMA